MVRLFVIQSIHIDRDIPPGAGRIRVRTEIPVGKPELIGDTIGLCRRPDGVFHILVVEFRSDGIQIMRKREKRPETFLRCNGFRCGIKHLDILVEHGSPMLPSKLDILGFWAKVFRQGFLCQRGFKRPDLFFHVAFAQFLGVFHKRLAGEQGLRQLFGVLPGGRGFRLVQSGRLPAGREQKGEQGGGY